MILNDLLYFFLTFFKFTLHFLSFFNVISEIIFMFTIVAKIQIDEMERYIKYFDFKRMTKNFVHGILV